MRKLNLSILLGILIISFNSCKKGCIDPYAKNYNSKKTKDNGKCDYYSVVKLHSIDVKTIPSKNSNGHFWDAGLDDDLDNDQSYPDLYLWYKAEGGYSLEPTTYQPTVDPLSVNKNFNLSPALSLTEWKNDKGFWVYFEEVDLSGSSFESIDSILIKPFDKNGSGKRFKDTMDITVGQISITANMSWE